MAFEAAKLPGMDGGLRRQFESLKTLLVSIPYWVVLLPLALWALILLVMQTPAGWVTEKPVQEIAAPVVIGLAAILALFVHHWVRQLFTLMLACFAWALFMRELHFPGTSNGFYAAIVILAGWAWFKRGEIADFISQRPISVLLTGAFATYIVTKFLDRHYVSFLPGYPDWHNNAEESLETLGHLIVFSLVVTTLRIGGTASAGKQPARRRRRK